MLWRVRDRQLIHGRLVRLAVGSIRASHRVFEPAEPRPDCVERRYRFRSNETHDLDEERVARQFLEAEIITAR